MSKATMVLVTLAGCGVVPGLVCTEIGCSSVLTVDVLDAPLADRDIEVTATVNGDEVPCSADEDGLCVLADTGSGWTATVVLPSGDASQVALTVVEGGDVLFDGEVGVTWGEGVRPNGPGCEPVCYQAASAEVNVVAPAR